MSPQRRTVLRLAGLGTVTTLAGCLDPSEPGENGSNGGNGSGDGSGNGSGDGSDETVVVDTHPFVTHTSHPQWDTESKVGRAVLIDSEERRRAVLASYDVSEERSDELGAFLADIDYERERLLFVESAGPNACHDRLELTNVAFVEGRLRGEATVIDTSEDETACADVVSFPSSLARIGFDRSPADSADVEVTDGWGETATISATVDDPLGPDTGSLEGSIRPDAEADPVEPLACDRSNVRRHPQAFEEADLMWGDLEHDGRVEFGLRIENTEYGYGDTARIELTNVTDEPVHTGNSAKYNVQVYTEEGWQDVRVTDGDRYFEYTDEAIEHPPGEGFEWSFELTESELTAGTYHDHAQVCPDLAAGRYRFAFFGIIDGAVAVGFDLRKEN